MFICGMYTTGRHALRDNQLLGGSVLPVLYSVHVEYSVLHYVNYVMSVSYVCRLLTRPLWTSDRCSTIEIWKRSSRTPHFNILYCTKYNMVILLKWLISLSTICRPKKKIVGFIKTELKIFLLSQPFS